MKLYQFFVPALCTLALAACSDRSAELAQDDVVRTGARGESSDCTPLETRRPNATDQQPAFEGQTRACGVTSNVQFDVQVVAGGLEHPWAVEPMPDGKFLITERPGRMRIVSATGEIGEPLAGLPDVDAGGQGGLLDVALGPDFQSDRMIYWSFSEPRQGGNATSVARGRLSDDGSSIEQAEVIFRSEPAYAGDKHFGSRLAFGPEDGALYITIGERSDTPMRRHAQELDNHLGKTIRIMPDGTVPDDNPFVNEAGARPEIWTYGHRNPQSAAFDEAGRYWVIEHGTRGGDELNLIERGNNYGWPVVAYGIEYAGTPIASAETQRPEGNFTQPVYYWDPVIAPSGAQFYSGDAFPEWQGSLFIGALGGMRLVRLEIDNNRVTGEEHLLTDRNRRIRDVRQGPDGALYLVTDHRDGELLRIAPQN